MKVFRRTCVHWGASFPIAQQMQGMKHVNRPSLMCSMHFHAGFHARRNKIRVHLSLQPSKIAPGAVFYDAPLFATFLLRSALEMRLCMPVYAVWMSKYPCHYVWHFNLLVPLLDFVSAAVLLACLR